MYLDFGVKFNICEILCKPQQRGHREVGAGPAGPAVLHHRHSLQTSTVSPSPERCSPRSLCTAAKISPHSSMFRSQLAPRGDGSTDGHCCPHSPAQGSWTQSPFLLLSLGESRSCDIPPAGAFTKETRPGRHRWRSLSSHLPGEAAGNPRDFTGTWQRCPSRGSKPRAEPSPSRALEQGEGTGPAHAGRGQDG